jgi:hypothetical protein
VPNPNAGATPVVCLLFPEARVSDNEWLECCEYITILTAYYAECLALVNNALMAVGDQDEDKMNTYLAALVKLTNSESIVVTPAAKNRIIN